MKTNSLIYFQYMAAAEYSCGTYGAGAYQSEQCETTSSGGGSGGLLPDTGYDVLIPLALGGALVIATVIFFVRKAWRSKK
ncbi:MAG TPA: LPXTG cell wall anchor domain-containing protein [Candidatus Saccharibacteria bacterium]|nr:LPXTG cell wall anchor domain-containing protein [Candidatus Saccharibacteria bacterium]HRK93941.1 LPXTG cell wall anchor domain-containing protein [Candidatus Saccharibacteria bacterium]